MPKNKNRRRGKSATAKGRRLAADLLADLAPDITSNLAALLIERAA